MSSSSTNYGALESDEHHHGSSGMGGDISSSSGGIGSSSSRMRRMKHPMIDDTNSSDDAEEQQQIELSSNNIEQLQQHNIIGSSQNDRDTLQIDDEELQNIDKKPKTIVRYLRMIWNWILHNILLIFTLVGVVLGLIIGISLNVSANGPNPTIEISQMTIDFLKLPGELFLRALNCLIVPLIVSSMVTSITSIVDTIKEKDNQNNPSTIDNNSHHHHSTPPEGAPPVSNNNYTTQLQKKKHAALMKMACITLSFYFMTTFIAVVTGLVMVNLIQPGKIKSNNNTNQTTTHSIIHLNNNHQSTIINLQGDLYPINGIMNIFTTRMLMMENINNNTNSTGQTSSYHQVISIIESFVPNNLIDAASNQIGGSVNVLGLIVFSVVFALVLLVVGEPARPIIKLFNSLNIVILKMVSFIICYAPIGIMFLIIWRCVKEKDLLQAISQLFLYIATVFSGLAFHSIVTLTVLYTVLVRKNIFKHLWAVFPALMTGLGTASSSATLPLTMKCCEERGNVQREVASFVLPLGSTVNMDGTATYEAIAAIFIAQVLGIELSIGEMIIVAITATLASIGAAGIPEAGLVTLILVIESVGLPKESVGLILSVDWFLDRARTTINIYGDTVAAQVVNRYVRFDEIVAATENIATTENTNNEKTRLV